MRALLSVSVSIGFLVGCNESLPIKDGYEFVVDEAAVMVGGPLNHCRHLMGSEYYCQRTSRNDYDAVISSGIYQEFDRVYVSAFLEKVASFEGISVRSPVDYIINMRNGRVLMLTKSDSFSDQNFSNAFVLIHPLAKEALMEGADGAGDELHYGAEEVLSYIQNSCGRVGDSSPDVSTLGGVYWVVSGLPDC